MLALVFGAPYAPQFVVFENQLKQSQAQHMQATYRATNDEVQPPGAPVAAMSHIVVGTSVARRSSLAPQPRAIPSAFTRRTSAAAVQLGATSQSKPPAVRAI